MKEHPILFSAPMVRATLDGRKTQTRRPVKFPKWANPKDDAAKLVTSPGPGLCHINDCGTIDKTFICPHGQPGDHLWVRETWRESDSHTWQGCQCRDAIHYRADIDEPPADGCWKPSIFMPRWASRITLEITDVRVEKLKSISAIDATEEGVECVEEYANLWRKINGSDSWAENPWVWVIEFKKI